MVGFYACLILMGVFLLLALLFALGGEKAANWLSGFSSLPEAEKARYDRKRMAREQRNAFLLWALIMLLGTAGCLWISEYAAFAAYGIWLALFFKDVHLDLDKAYGKYKKGE